MVLNIANDSSFGNRSKGQDIANDEICLLSTVEELTNVYALDGDEELILLLVSEWVAEHDSGEWGASTRVVDDLGHHSFQVPISLAEIQAPKTQTPHPYAELE